ncbi:MAG: hypothetical protein CVV51_13690 [Spirochaetae bacterium HGW-Spirochaetae-7]|nr:MAG: hypothetical protein CVV51_13690 [Spirochaetae bacterium HGW-Spirochaetae-7]
MSSYLIAIQIIRCFFNKACLQIVEYLGNVARVSRTIIRAAEATAKLAEATDKLSDAAANLAAIGGAS